MGGWCEGRYQEARGEKLEECYKEQGQLAEASKEGLGSEWAVVPMMMMLSTRYITRDSVMSLVFVTKTCRVSCEGATEIQISVRTAGFKRVKTISKSKR
jgi:hypothetical protein